MCSYWQDLAWDCNHHFSHICTSVMALDFRQNFVPIQYLENKWTWFHQILYNNICIHIDKNYVGIVTHHFLLICTLQSYGPWFTPKFCYCSISWEQKDRISPNFIYYLNILFILTRSMLGLLAVIFRKFGKSYVSWLMSKLCYHSISWETLAFICMQSIAAGL